MATSCPSSFKGPIPTITLGGGFSPITGLTFLGKSEEKGERLHKLKCLFNVRELQIYIYNEIIH